MTMRWIAAGLMIAASIGSAAAQQHTNQAQQAAYAQAFNGRWMKDGNRNEYDVKNDGKEVRFSLVVLSQASQQLGFKSNDVVYQGSFRGPDFTGFNLSVLGGDANGRANVRIKCQTDRFWVPTTGKMNFD